MEEVDTLYGIVPGKSNALLFFFIYTVNRIAHLAISNIWNEQHIAVSVISLNTYWFQDLHGWIIDLTSEKNYITLSIHAIHSHFSPSMLYHSCFSLFETDGV